MDYVYALFWLLTIIPVGAADVWVIYPKRGWVSMIGIIAIIIAVFAIGDRWLDASKLVLSTVWTSPPEMVAIVLLIPFFFVGKLLGIMYLKPQFFPGVR